MPWEVQEYTCWYVIHPSLPSPTDAVWALSPSADNSYLLYPSPVPSPPTSLAATSLVPTPPLPHHPRTVTSTSSPPTP
ncbi:hypothetical protein F5887DRAFT_1091943 [Amanita rubescens]|nr:hypothetical protein F5887DRAFT_1091943 [Amanita rubescens]